MQVRFVKRLERMCYIKHYAVKAKESKVWEKLTQEWGTPTRVAHDTAVKMRHTLGEEVRNEIPP